MVHTCTPRALLVYVTTAVVILIQLCPFTVHAQIDHAYVEGEVLIKFASGASQSDVATILDGLQGAEAVWLRSIDAGLYRIQIPVEEAIQSLFNHPAIDYIEPNYLWYPEEIPNDPMFADLWGLHNTGQTGGTPGADISAVEAWDITKGSPQVVVAVIDTGTDITHPDLADNIYHNPGEIPGNGIDDDANGFIDDVNGWDFANDDNDPFDDHGHGTHTAGTIGAVGNNGIGVVGVNWTVKIMPIKFLSPAGGSTADAIASVEYATLMGVHMTSNSWGGGAYSLALEEAIDAASQAGIFFVASSGNSGLDTDVFPHYPSSYEVPNVISVAATDHNDLLAGFSNYGLTSVDLAAPGVDIRSTLPGGSYGFNSGTSMATPHVTGVLALMRAMSPDMPMETMKGFLLSTADPVPSLAGRVATGGRLNAYSAVLVVAEPDSTPPAPVDDLAVIEVMSNNGIRIQWTATGDDGHDGTASLYDVRYADFSIDESNFALATRAHDSPDPSPPGSLEEMVMQGLDYDTTYHFALKVLDEWGNASLISNVVDATTFPPPQIVVSPLVLNEALLTGASSTHPLSIQNDGASDLAYSISISDATGVSKASTSSLYERYPEAMVPVTSSDRNPYDGASSSSKQPRTWSLPGSLATTSAGGLDVLIVHAGDVTEIQNALLQFPDINVVDVFDGGMATPALTDLMAYDSVILAPNFLWADPFLLGDNLADYADAGGGVIMTTPSHVSGFELAGRFLADGYSPFETGFGPIGSGALGSFDTSHPIMDGVTAATGDLLATAQLAAGAQWVADWNIGEACVATQGDNVVGVNVFVASAGTWTGDIPLILRNAVGWASTIPWLTVFPDAGTVPAGGSMVLDVTFDATGLVGGAYDKTIVVDSNDPVQPEVQVAAHLDVTGAPDISVTPVSLDYGVVFLGLVAQQTLQVCNPGTDLLQVTSITSDSPNFSADLAAFDLDPGQCQEVMVSFSPAMVGMYDGTLTIMSNDPDEAQVDVPLNGQGAECPVITASPAAIVSSLLTNEIEVQTLELGNLGGSDLEFTIGTQTPEHVVVLTAPSAYGTTFDGGQAPPDPVRTTPLEVALSDLTDLNILWDISRGQPSPFSWSILIADLTSRGATVTENFVPITPELLSGFDVIWSADVSSTWSSAEIAAIVDWVRAGGSMLFEGDNSSTVVAFNTLLTALGAGIELSDTSGADGITTLIEPHPTTENVNGIFFSANVAHVSAITSPAALLVSDVAGVPASAYSEVGGGRVLAVTDEVFSDGRMGTADNQLWGNQVFDWFAQPRWLSVAPAEGIVPPLGTLPVDVTLDAAGLFGGVYEMELSILSNDCLTPELIIPVTLNVTGRPDLAVSDTLLDFGTIFFGGTADLTLVVSNIGTDLLTVTSIAVDDPAYLVDTMPFDLAPAASRNLVVTYSPTMLGPVSATLSLESNDPDGATLVALSGDAVEPPDIDVTPISLTEALFTGETSVQTLTIANLGVAPLEFTLETEDVTPPLAKATSSEPTQRREYEVTGQRASNRLEADGSPVTGASYTFGALPENVLLFADDYVLGPGQHYIDFALQSLGMSYTAYYGDVSGFELALAAGGWDLVLIDNNSYFINSSVWDSVENHVLGGGSVLISTFDIDATAVSTSLWTTLGVSPQQDNQAVQPVYWWDPSHRIFNSPENVPEFTQMNDEYLDNGDKVDAIVPASAVAGFTTAVGPGEGAIVLSSSTKSVVNSFLVVENRSDLDQDGIPDATELFINEISHLSKFVSWLLPDPAEGTVLPGQSVDIQVTFDATGLIGGVYDANLLVNSNDPDEPVVAVPTHLDVTGAPDITLSDTAFDFGPVFIAAVETRTLTVSNEGTDLLTVTSITSDEADFAADPAAFDLAVGQSQSVSVSFTPSRVGVIAGVLTVASNDPVEPVLEVTLQGEGVEPPDIAVSPDSLNAVLLAGASTTRILTIENNGATDLAFDLNTVLQSAAQQGAAATAVQGAAITSAGRLQSKAGASQTTVSVTTLAVEAPAVETRADIVDFAVLQDDFEDGNFDGWLIAGGSGIREVTSTTAADSTQYSYHEYNSSGGHFDGIYREMGSVQPAYVGFWVRSGSRFSNDGYFALRNAAGFDVITFHAHDTGRFFVNPSVGGSTSYVYAADTWYHIEFRDINFTFKTFNFYIDGNLVLYGVPMKNAGVVQDVYRLDLHNFDAGSEAWWDEIVISGDPFLEWLTAEPASGTILPGGATQVLVTFDAANLAEGVYAADILVQSNDPDTPLITVPVHLDVTTGSDVVELAMGNASGAGGATVSVPFTVSLPNPGKLGDPSQTAGVDLVVHWDPTIATLLDVSLTAATSDWLMEFNPGMGTVDVSMATLNPIDVSPAGVEFLVFDFELADVEGVTPLSIVDSHVFDLSQTPITHVTVDGSLAAGCEKGDVIADGEINSADAIRGLLIAMDLIVPTPQELCAADMNLDGVVDVGDIVLILQRAVGITTTVALEGEPARIFARAGAEIGDVILRVENAAGLDLTMTYDPSAVSFVSAEAPGSKGLTATNDQSPGTLRLGFARETSYDGDILMKFEVTEPHTTLTLQDAIAFDEAGVKQPVELSTPEFIFGVTGVVSPDLGFTKLLNAVPNPFNPMTELRFTLASAGDARLTIFNVAGRRVREFQMRGLAAGEHRVTWDGRDDGGARVASGAYLVRFEAAGTTDTGRVLMLK